MRFSYRFHKSVSWRHGHSLLVFTKTGKSNTFYWLRSCWNCSSFEGGSAFQVLIYARLNTPFVQPSSEERWWISYESPTLGSWVHMLDPWTCPQHNSSFSCMLVSLVLGDLSKVNNMPRCQNQMSFYLVSYLIENLVCPITLHWLTLTSSILVEFTLKNVS